MNAPAEIPMLRTRLSAQMFLQFAVWGAWVPVLGNHLLELKFTMPQIGMVYGTGALALMISPLIAGQIADRWFATQQFMSVAYLGAAAFFYLAARSTDYDSVWWLSLAAMLFFGPTLGLANALCFHHLKDAQKDFPVVRVFGTVGWIAAGWILSYWMEWQKRPFGDALYFGAAFSFVNGIYSLTLPHTPPKKNEVDKSAIGKVLAMLLDPSFAVFSVLAFLLLVCATFYFNFAGMFIQTGVGLQPHEVSRVMSIGQIMEIVTMLALPFFLARAGIKFTIAIGIAAWALRFFLYATGTPALLYAAQALHGVCFAFAIAGSMIYVERISAPDIRGSMQSFLAWLTYGLGMFAGALVAGRVSGHFTTQQVVDEKTVAVTDWKSVWMVPAIGCVAILVTFLVGFKDRSARTRS